MLKVTIMHWRDWFHTRLVEAPREDVPTVVPRFTGIPVEPGATEGRDRVEVDDSNSQSERISSLSRIFSLRSANCGSYLVWKRAQSPASRALMPGFLVHL